MGRESPGRREWWSSWKGARSVRESTDQPPRGGKYARRALTPPTLHLVLLTVHLLAAAVWLGGTVVLVFVAVPVIRGLEGKARATALRTLGRRWRPLGWGAMAILVASGLGLAVDQHALNAHVLLATTGGRILLVKSVLVLALIASSALHDFVLGPRLARELAGPRAQRARRSLIRIGWTSFSLSVLVPILGIVFAELQ